jgi:hypothetical protein
MSEKHLTGASDGQDPGNRMGALFYRRRIRANGESDEISLGASAVWLVRWIVALVVVAVLTIIGGGTPSIFWRLLMKMLP